MPRTLVIAEVGVNHDGSVDKALELIDVAADAGADVVKFQTFDLDEVVTDDAPQAEYQQQRSPAASQIEMLRPLWLDRAAHEVLAARCEDRGIEFLSTAFDTGSLEWLLEMGIRRVKVPSGELTNGPLLLAFARTGLPLVVSTGMADLGDVETALGVLAFGRAEPTAHPDRGRCREAYAAAAREGWPGQAVTLLHCTSSYPAPPGDVNLAAVTTLRSAFGLPVGYSDHTLGIAVSLAAVALGAVVLEKHITLDRDAPGPDHAASLEPDDLRKLVSGIRDVEAALGTGAKFPTEDELRTAAVARRSLVTTRAIAPGEPFRPEDLTALRPGTGRSPMDTWDLIGRPASRAYGVHEAIDPRE
jgi:N-acetylneuraminate synthase